MACLDDVEVAQVSGGSQFDTSPSMEQACKDPAVSRLDSALTADAEDVCKSILF